MKRKEEDVTSPKKRQKKEETCEEIEKIELEVDGISDSLNLETTQSPDQGSFWELLNLTPPSENNQKLIHPLPDLKENPKFEPLPKKKLKRNRKKKPPPKQKFINFLSKDFKILRFSNPEKKNFEDHVIEMEHEGLKAYNVRKGFYHISFTDSFFENVESFSCTLQNHNVEEEKSILLNDYKEKEFVLDLFNLEEFTQSSFLSLEFHVFFKDGSFGKIRSKLIRPRKGESFKECLEIPLHFEKFGNAQKDYQKSFK